ncbi:MAG: hypothetical protein QJR01_04305 [Kyrpidia sp.]|nr:hypothetical protein [Kyrpidia sp.]
MRGGKPDAGGPVDRELADLEKLVSPRLAPYPVREATAEESRRLAERVLLRAQAEEDAGLPKARLIRCKARVAPSLWTQVRLQMGTYGAGFWIISLALFALLVLASTGRPAVPGEQPANLFSLVFPGYVLASMTYGHLSGNRGMRLVESVTSFPPALIWLTRILIVAGMNIVLGLVGTGYLALTVRGVQPLPFLLQWLSAVFAVCGFVAWVLFHKGFRRALVAGLAVWAVTVGGQQGLLWTGFDWNGWVQGVWLLLGFALGVAAWRRGCKSMDVRQRPII